MSRKKIKKSKHMVLEPQPGLPDLNQNFTKEELAIIAQLASGVSTEEIIEQSGQDIGEATLMMVKLYKKIMEKDNAKS